MRARDFTRVLSTGRRHRVGGITVVTAPGTGDLTRVGLVAGRKVGKAVQRNRAKRRIRHAMAGLEVPAGLDVVVIIGPEVVEVPFSTLREWLRRGVAERA